MYILGGGGEGNDLYTIFLPPEIHSVTWSPQIKEKHGMERTKDILPVFETTITFPIHILTSVLQKYELLQSFYILYTYKHYIIF